MTYSSAGPAEDLVQVLYVDDCLIVASKPALMHSVELPKDRGVESTGEGTVASYLRQNFPETARAAETPGDGGLVNRLDFETSGVVIAARSRAVWLALRDQFKKRLPQKLYVAVVEGALTEQWVETYLGSPHRRARKTRVSRSLRPRFQLAHTHFRPLAHSVESNLSLVQVTIEEGLRHQIRAQASFIGSPLAGDALYGSSLSLGTHISPGSHLSPENYATYNYEAGPNGKVPPFFLHACSLTIGHPSSGRQCTLTAPAPNYLVQFSLNVFGDVPLTGNA